MIAYIEGVALSRLAKDHGTPLYAYSKSAIRKQCQAVRDAFDSHPTLPCYAAKANANLTLLKEIFGYSFGADVVSIGELKKSLLAGAVPERIVFSGVGKLDEEIEAALGAGIFALLAESAGECARIKQIASRKGVVARVGLRINPNINVDTNPHIATGLYETKFGVPEAEARDIAREFFAGHELRFVGLSCHLGSQILDLGPFQEAARSLARLSSEFRNIGHRLEFIDMGGGLGIAYCGETPPTLPSYAQALLTEIAPTGLKLLLEPGRLIVGNAGIILTRVIDIKCTPLKTFVITDASMTELIRPALYGAYHEIVPVKPRPHPPSEVDIVGPVCETGDFLGLRRSLPLPEVGDLLVVKSTGAYGSSMASNYNQRPRAPELWIDGDAVSVIRRREPLEDLWRLES